MFNVYKYFESKQYLATTLIIQLFSTSERLSKVIFKKILPTIFKIISGNHWEKDLGGSIYGLARTSFFFLKNPPPQPPPGPFKFENSGPKIDNYQFKKQIFSSVLPYQGKTGKEI